MVFPGLVARHLGLQPSHHVKGFQEGSHASGKTDNDLIAHLFRKGYGK